MSSGEMASMVDELVEQAERMADGVNDVAAANEEQVGKVRERHDSVQKLSGTEPAISYISPGVNVEHMEDEAWRSVTVIDDKKGQPHVLQQRVKVYTQGRDEESAGYTKPEMKHRLVPVKDVVEL